MTKISLAEISCTRKFQTSVLEVEAGANVEVGVGGDIVFTGIVGLAGLGVPVRVGAGVLVLVAEGSSVLILVGDGNCVAVTTKTVGVWAGAVSRMMVTAGVGAGAVSRTTMTTGVGVC